MKIAGLWNSHDSSFCVLEDGVPTIHAELERYTREKEPKGDSFELFKKVYKNEKDIKYWVTCSPLDAFKEGSKRCVKVGDDFNHEIYGIGHHPFSPPNPKGFHTIMIGLYDLISFLSCKITPIRNFFINPITRG